MPETVYRCALLFGAPGTGKGTQGKILGHIPGFYHLSTGDMFRGLDKQSELGQEFLKYSTRGELVPDDFTIRLWRDHMAGLVREGHYRPAQDLLLLDGIPRTPVQAELLRDDLDVRAIIHLGCRDEQELIARLSRRAQQEGRPDDADEAVIARRLDVYRGDTKPVLDHFDASLVHDIDALGTPARVLRDVLAVLEPIVSADFNNPFSGRA